MLFWAYAHNYSISSLPHCQPLEDGIGSGNYSYSVLHEGQVALETINPSSPGVLKPVGVDNYIRVVMPMFVQWQPIIYTTPTLSP
jgi:hypothetical protein